MKLNVSIIFFFLGLFGFVFLLSYMYTMESVNSDMLAALHQLPSRMKSSFLPINRTKQNKHTFCAHLGKKPSPADELEERYLLDSIAWPLPPARAEPIDWKITSDPLHSDFSILPIEGGKEWHVGDQLEVLIKMRDFEGRVKRYGGDFILASLHSPELLAGVGGKVLDHKNGLYIALFPLLWEGSVQVQITLVHSNEAIAVLQRLSDERPDRMYFHSLFRLGDKSETTVCNVCLPPNEQPVCNFTDLHTGEPWYCYKPQMLECDTRINHFRGNYRGAQELISDSEALLLQPGINMKVPIKAAGPDSVTVLPPREDKVEAQSSTEKPGGIRVAPSGYFYKGSWRPLNGDTMHQFSISSAITQCLTRKMIHIYGDSTARQWYEYLMAVTPGLNTVDLSNREYNGPVMAVDGANNILLKYRSHGPPIRFEHLSASEMRFVPNEVDGLTGGPNTVVLLSVWAHFSAFPIELYIRRLRHIRLALVRLLGRAPETRIVVRSGNLQTLDQTLSLYYSDWYNLQRYRVFKAMFKGMNVLMVDAWQMSLAHHLPHNLHPQPAIIKNMVDMILSYICPEQKSQ